MTNPRSEEIRPSLLRRTRRFFGAFVNLGASRAHASAVERETFAQLADLNDRMRTIEEYVESPGNESRETLSRRAAIENQLVSVPHALRELTRRIDKLAGSRQSDKV